MPDLAVPFDCDNGRLLFLQYHEGQLKTLQLYD